MFCMHMKSKLVIKGGYGEHGRSCFLLSYHDGYIMLDCGILDTDPNPYPDVDEDTIKKVKYIFISHCHKDHIGAFKHFVNKGFLGTVVTTKATYELAKIEYENIVFIDAFNQWVSLDEGIRYFSGRSGHCPGAVWFQLQVDENMFFYSGDYQEDTLAYLCDKPRGIKGNVAIIDLAHKYAGGAKERRGFFISKVKEYVSKDRLVVLPMQKYGRGVEVLYQLLENCENDRIKLDKEFHSNLRTTLSYETYFVKEAYSRIIRFLETYTEPEEYDVLILGDTHLEKKENIKRIESLSCKKKIISTGRIKKGGYIESLYNQDVAIKCTYTHHQSIEDMEKMIESNRFDIVIPFHNNEKEMLTF